eukprot:5455686-Alexandrium_andersonii.AAC.1
MLTTCAYAAPKQEQLNCHQMHTVLSGARSAGSWVLALWAGPKQAARCCSLRERGGHRGGLRERPS